MTEHHLQCDKCGREWHSELLSPRIPCPSCGGALRTQAVAVERDTNDGRIGFSKQLGPIYESDSAIGILADLICEFESAKCILSIFIGPNDLAALRWAKAELERLLAKGEITS